MTYSIAQKNHFGRGCSRNLQKELRIHGVTRLFLVTGEQSFEFCTAKEILPDLMRDFDVLCFNVTSTNPSYEEALHGAAIFRQHACDSIVAIGGGKVIDTAKSIAAFQAYPGNEYRVAMGSLCVAKPLPPLFALPTTTGTGSESTRFAAIYVDGTKHSIESSRLLPTGYFLDANFTDSLPGHTYASAGFDALSHAVESFWALGGTPESRRYAAKAIHLCLRNIKAGVGVTDGISRENMLYAANWAGRAIDISKTTASHALSYALSAYTGLPHGHSVAVTLGNFFDINHRLANETSTSNAKAYRELETRLFALLAVNNVVEAKAMWYNLMGSCGLATRLDCLSSSDIAAIVSSANLQRLYNHPLLPTTEQLFEAVTNRCHIWLIRSKGRL